MSIEKTVDEISKTQNITLAQLKQIFSADSEALKYLHNKARQTAVTNYGHKIFLRGLIEISSYCKNDCLYCGLRKSNRHALRYRLTEDEILSCCKSGYELGFKTFVLQGGEDAYYSDDVMSGIVSKIKKLFPSCAVTLSLGERSKESYQRLFNAGADRYLLRHETADATHYGKLHPPQMSLKNRMECLYNLKEIGYQTGCGIMVGSPYQTLEHIYEDFCFMKDLNPHMIGIGPFIKHKDTPFNNKNDGSVRDTLIILSLLRLIFPKVLLPATTALGTKDPMGREKGILAGANVLMPNLSPVTVRRKYLLYDNKICTGEEAAECKLCLQARIEKIGYYASNTRGDFGEGC